MINLAICDDNKAVLDKLEAMIHEHYQNLVLIRKFDNAFALETYLTDDSKGNVQILLMDIQLGDDNGIAVAKKIQKYFSEIKIIFISAYLDNAKYIFEVEPIYFLTKPIEDEKLFMAIDRALAKINAEEKRTIAIVTKGMVSNIKVDDIMYLESNKRTLYLHLRQDIKIANIKMQEVLNRLPDTFIQCHQSYAVNMEKIKNFSMEGAELYDGQIVPVSRQKYSAVRSRFLKFVGESY